MDLQLDGRTAVVTGAGKGIGLAITRALVAEGVHVVAGSRTLSPELESLQSGGAVTFVGVDLASVEGSTDCSRLQQRGAASTSWSTTSGPSPRERAVSRPSQTKSGRRRSI